MTSETVLMVWIVASMVIAIAYALVQAFGKPMSTDESPENLPYRAVVALESIALSLARMDFLESHERDGK